MTVEADTAFVPPRACRPLALCRGLLTVGGGRAAELQVRKFSCRVLGSLTKGDEKERWAQPLARHFGPPRPNRRLTMQDLEHRLSPIERRMLNAFATRNEGYTPPDFVGLSSPQSFRLHHSHAGGASNHHRGRQAGASSRVEVTETGFRARRKSLRLPRWPALDIAALSVSRIVFSVVSLSCAPQDRPIPSAGKVPQKTIVMIDRPT